MQEINGLYENFGVNYEIDKNKPDHFNIRRYRSGNEHQTVEKINKFSE